MDFVKQFYDILELEREPTHPGEILLEDFLLPFNISQTKLAVDIGVSFKTINEIINQKR
ncbi:MAG: HigA family addiction module antitoxin, partial [Candidatus Sericytochromatia bacterium]